MNNLQKIWSECNELYTAKAKDYGNTDQYRNFNLNAEIWGTTNWEEMCHRASEKMIRISNLRHKEASFEGIDDSMKDGIILMSMALDAYRTQNEKR